ncbi:hypothetical protein HY412_00935 [Candidatus Kaiserbacteria bacterium]|nr:hypothetical protein [Candidatus Kaiserbacteria bacterium]
MLRRASSEPRGSERFAERRRRRRRRTLSVFFVLLIILLTATVYGLQHSAVRILHAEVISADASLSAYATNAMQGNYFGIIPRGSIFFFPEERIRADILSSHNDIAAVSILRNGFTGISIKIDYRVPIARWCGDATRFNPAIAGLNLVADCYVFDSSGIIFSAVSTTTQTINTFKLYAPLVGETLEPLRAIILHAEELPAVFDFARQLATLGSQTVSVVIHGDEVDNILASGTRVTYVLGREQDAFTALVSARDNFNLADGSVDYIDLRFDGKVYVKKR